MKRLIFAVPVLALAGCFETQREQHRSEHVSRAISAEGTVGGVPFVVTAKEESVSDNDQVDHRAISVDPAVVAAVADVAKAAMPLIPGAGPILGGAVSLVAAGWAARERARANAANQRADEHKADADEAWDKLVDSPKPAAPDAKGATSG